MDEAPLDPSALDQVRRFNRAVTRRIGALADDYLGRGRPLAGSRLLFEIGREGADVGTLRARLALDSGYLSRLLRALEAEGLVQTRPCEGDARTRRATLTRAGRREFAALDRRSSALASSVLRPLGSAQRARLLGAMSEVERLLRASEVDVRAAYAASAPALSCIRIYLEELDARFESGFDARRGPSAEAGELAPPDGAFFLARLDGEAIGCAGLKRLSRTVGEVKRMWVAPSARGLGVGQRLLESIQDAARAMGLRRLRLDTHRSLLEARALYLRNGFREIAPYNDNPYAHHWFEKRLVLRR
jgi:DNA-binding MarR family transcriptional regulator/GNAT superfamily N-acetyltransferase